MEFKKYKVDYFNDWMAMSLELFPNADEEELKQDLWEASKSKKHKIYFAILRGDIIGFINVSIRRDHVEGARRSPVGYIESLFVKPEFRKTGVAAQLVRKAEKWVYKKGCTQIGSDTWESNHGTREFHKSLGFKEDDVLVHFIKDIK